MIGHFRAFLDRPLGQGAAQAIVFLSCALLVGLALLFVLAVGQPDRTTPPDRAPLAASAAAPVPLPPVEGARGGLGGSSGRQDPQDVVGSPAARRVSRAIRSHRALQHVPYRSDEMSVALIGARGHRAVLRVSAPTAAAARVGWLRFLHRFGDPGGAYIPIFTRRGGRDG